MQHHPETPKKVGTFKSFDGTSIYYEVRGDGPPLVLCYGIACLINHWRHQIKEFSKNYQVITFDYRAHHLSAKPENLLNQSIPALAQDVQFLLQHLNIPKASFWAHSFGGQVLLQTYKDNPTLFENLVLVNAFANNPIKKVFGKEVAVEAFRYLKQGYSHKPRALTFFWKWSVDNPLAHYIAALLGGFNLELTALRDIEVYSRGVSAISLDHFIALFEDMMAFRGEPILSTISVPTLIVGGKKDRITPLKHQYLMHEKIPNSELLEIPYGSHCSQLDMPELLNLRIEKFLKKNGY